MSRVTQVLPVAAGTALVAAAIFAGAGAADPGDPATLTGVPTANTRSDGYAPANRLSPELEQVVVAQGSTKLENPSALTSFYGYDNDVLNADGQPQMLPTPTSATEATKTEPDKNVYLVFERGLRGADAQYDYGQRFLYQGHENGAGGTGSLTRINLDADAEHRVTLMADHDVDGNPIKTIDGATWDPFSQRLILTTESASKPTYAATADFPSQVTDVSGALGRGGYEGVQSDADGNIWFVEDIGGAGKDGTKAKLPNSFVYRYVPAQPGDLAHGRLEALQVVNGSGQPITQASETAINNADQVALHTYGTSFRTRWVAVHDTAVDGTASFDANAAAKEVDATPFKRPENGQFAPGSKFTEFYFDETGDTDTRSPENATAGGYGSVLKLTQSSPSAATGRLEMFYKGDEAHNGLDNVTFLSRDKVTFVEDAGDTMHSQRNALDSGYVLDVNLDYANAANQPVRWLAEGRDASATLDAANGGFGKNDGDNEITGVHVSDGDPITRGLLGAKIPNLRDPHWRWFWTQQHGDNNTYEVLVRSQRRGDE